MYNKDLNYNWRHNNIDKYNEYMREYMREYTKKHYDPQKRKQKYLREKERKILKKEINNIDN